MSIAARGAPAVPDVKSSTASSASSRSTSASIGAAVRSSPARNGAGQLDEVLGPGADDQHPGTDTLQLGAMGGCG